eukprot:COSAG01_NODE_9395_length_2456_cov_1.263783_1_plen_100_part_00
MAVRRGWATAVSGRPGSASGWPCAATPAPLGDMGAAAAALALVAALVASLPGSSPARWWAGCSGGGDDYYALLGVARTGACRAATLSCPRRRWQWMESG